MYEQTENPFEKQRIRDEIKNLPKKEIEKIDKQSAEAFFSRAQKKPAK